MVAVLIRLALFAAVAYAIWKLVPVLRRALRNLDEIDEEPSPARPFGPRLVPMERTPQDVLGLSENAGPKAIRAAWLRMIAENHPDRVADMSPEIRELAARLTREANEAYAELMGERAPEDDALN